MTFTSTIDKTRKEIENSLSDLTPLYAVVGIGDVAVATIRSVRADVSARAARLDPKAVRYQARTRIAARVGAVQSDVRATPGQVKTLPSMAQVLLDEAVSNALSTYGDLAGRGKTLVTRVRSQQATVELEKQAKTTVAKAKAASTTARKSAAATKTAAKSTRTTTRKSASDSRTAVKSAATSAKKTATAAKKAADAGAAKLGD